MHLPSDPIILLSFLNTRLRDIYPNLQALCEDLAVDPVTITEKMNSVGFSYDPERNQFI